MENKFKKEDVNGNKLPEQIGKGLNLNHPSPKVKKMLNNRLEIVINRMDKVQFQNYCKPFGGVSVVLRSYITNCINR